MRSAPDDHVISRLLDALAGNIYGIIDTATAAYASDSPALTTNIGRYLDGRREVLPAMVIVLREFLGDEVHTVKALQIALQEIAGACNEMLDAFIVLQTFRSRLISELRDATDAVGRSYLRIFASLQVLIGVTRIAAPNVDSLSADRAAYYDGIVQHLFETFRLERNEPANP